MLFGMKKRILSFLICPQCQERLQLSATIQNRGEILSGRLTCSSCSAEYHLEGGIPYFAPSFDETTKESFGYSWAKFSDIYENQKADFLDWIHPVRPDFFKGKTVLDAGAGTGLHSCFAAEFGAREVWAMDLSSAVKVARENCRDHDNVHIVQGNIYSPPFPKEAFDYVFSIGVLQHLPEKKKAVWALSSLVKTGGSLFLWVYSDEVSPAVKSLVGMLRLLTLRLDLRLVYWMSFPWAVLFYFFGRAARALSGLPFLPNLLPMTDYFLYMSQFPFKYQHNTVFDQLIAPRTYYFKKEELEDIFREPRFKRLHISSRNGMSWRVFAQEKL
jgi:SAM-dependent methyltransferase